MKDSIINSEKDSESMFSRIILGIIFILTLTITFINYNNIIKQLAKLFIFAVDAFIHHHISGCL